MLNIGVAGAGHLGKIHLKLLQQSEKFNLIGFHDTDRQTIEFAEKMGYQYFENLQDLLDQVDVLDIVTPTTSHFKIAEQAIKNKKHIFIEKPISQSLKEAAFIKKMAEEYGVLGQVGHVERFNPAFLAVQEQIKNPKFIEIHRLAEFNPRGTDVPVVLDLMIHDLDIILSIIDSGVKEIRSNGVAVVSETPDIANARILFENGCVVNLTTSRISMRNMRKTRIFQRDAYISIDFLEKKSEIIRIEDAEENSTDEFSMILENAEHVKKKIYFEYPKIEANNAILQELEELADSINHGKPIKVKLEDGYKALELAYQIIDNF
ncbi:Virulence factor mviM-like protein [Candidatus Ornithobacterium hominis]|uniref:Gfo/Idh/MocA family protein n=1 Tax=Candidatus Ornithobacterium hominis TaxID=2497989 RepID=UPI0024BC7BC6|nr:Gfo/Idh/MocA family oxidoreductase [Candidatus Ornithobacterium hominis]CAI9429567.1 Virulence factor mviM-like protein [Candidatus Ornithobacterium hominis]